MAITNVSVHGTFKKLSQAVADSRHNLLLKQLVLKLTDLFAFAVLSPRRQARGCLCIPLKQLGAALLQI